MSELRRGAYKRLDEQSLINFRQVLKDLGNPPSREIAEKTRYTISAVDNYKNGNFFLSEGFLLRFCNAYNVDIKDVLVYTPEYQAYLKRTSEPESDQKKAVVSEEKLWNYHKLCATCLYGNSVAGNATKNPHQVVCEYLYKEKTRRPCKGPMHSEDHKCKCYQKRDRSDQAIRPAISPRAQEEHLRYEGSDFNRAFET